MGRRELLIIQAPNNYQIDCMGKVVNALDFCKTKFPEDQGLLRGYVNLKKKEVVCQLGSSAILAMSCDKKHSRYCLEPASSCGKLKKIFAHRLDLDHQSVLKSSSKFKGRHLNCYYSAKANLDNLLNDPLKLPQR